MTIQKIVIPSSFTNHSPLLKLGMTIQVIVIPKFQNPLWHSTALSYCHSHIHTTLHTHDFIVSTSIFQVFSIKTCWLLVSSISLLAGYSLITILSRISAKFRSNWVRLSRTSWVVFDRVHTSQCRVRDYWTLDCLCWSFVSWFGAKNFETLFWYFEFLGFLSVLRTRLAKWRLVGLNWDIVDLNWPFTI